MAKAKRVYKYGQCYKCPKTFVTYSIEKIYETLPTYSTNIVIRNMVTRITTTVDESFLDLYEQEYTYSE